MLRAGFAEMDITPPVGTQIIGWLAVIVSKTVKDPLFVRAAVFEAGGQRIAFIQLDLLSIRWKQVEAIRRRITETYGFPGGNVMIAATHNHAGPAVVNCGDARRDDAYLATLVEKTVAVFGEALSNMQEAEVGFGSLAEFDVSYNRRVVMRDGTVKTQATFENPDALTIEGPIDPEVAVLAVRKAGNREQNAAPQEHDMSAQGSALENLGVIVNFACHPTHHGSDGVLSAGFPGALAAEMKARGSPITLFLNGAAGNLIFFDARRSNRSRSPEEIGRILADDVEKILAGLPFRNHLQIAARSETVSLPFREITDAEIAGTVRGAQRFVDSAIYDREIPRVVERIRQRGSQPAQVQALFLDEYVYVAVPAEYFVELGLRIKEEVYPCRARVVGFANGMVGYVPHQEAFRRGGYETTFLGSSKMGPEAGDILADCAVRLIR